VAEGLQVAGNSFMMRDFKLVPGSGHKPFIALFLPRNIQGRGLRSYPLCHFAANALYNTLY